MKHNFWHKCIIFAVIILPCFSAMAKVQHDIDCSKATLEAEKLICSDQELLNLDKEMNKWNRAFMKTIDDAFYQNKLKQKRSDWLGYREKLSCFNTNDTKKINCLKNAYRRRIENLQNWTTRKNYDFFIDYTDYFEKRGEVGLLKSMDKFVSKLGEEYYIDCDRNTIIPRFPEEKLYFSGVEYTRFATYVDLNHVEEDFIYFRCISHSDLIPVEDIPLGEFSEHLLEVVRDIKINPYPQNKDDINDIIDFVKEENEVKIVTSTDANTFLPVEKCSELWDLLKSNNFEIIPYISANSSFELKEKANINCSNEQFYKMSKNEYGDYRRFIPPFKVFTSEKKTYLIANEDTNFKRICQVDTEKCYCRLTKSLPTVCVGGLLKINNQIYFADYSDFRNKQLNLSLITDETLDREYLHVSCIFVSKKNK